MPLIAFCSLLFCCSIPAQTNTNRIALPQLPNIILIVANHLAPGDLGCYGQTQILTPNIDNLASNGLRFNYAYAGAPTFSPSFAALMTGQDSGHCTIRGQGYFPLKADDFTIGDLLHNAGYSTTMLGQWSLGGPLSSGIPTKKGFDDWLGYLNEATPDDLYPKMLNRADTNSSRDLEVYGNEDGHGRYSSDYFTEIATNAIRLNKPTWYHNVPFFLCITYPLPLSSTKFDIIPEDAPYTSQPWSQAEKYRAAMISRLDRYVGSIVEKIDTYKKQGLGNNTLIIFTAATGPEQTGGVDPKYFRSTGFDRGGSPDLFEGGLRVPLIVVWPGRTKQHVTDFPVAAWDLLPTLAEITRQPALLTNSLINGISFLPTIMGYTQTKRHASFYWESPVDGFKQAVRFEDWKAVRFGVDGPIQLYNLHTDPSEKVDMAVDHPDIVARAAELLKLARTDDPHWPVQTAAKPATK